MVGQGEIERMVKAAVEKERDAVWQKVEAAKKQGVEVGRKYAESLEQRVAAFEVASGVNIDEWRADKIGDAVRFVLEGGVKGMENRITSILDSCRRIQQAAALAGVQESPCRSA